MGVPMTGDSSNLVARTMREALTSVLVTELRRSGSMLVMGETVRDGGASGVTRGLFDEFGSRRVVETPVSENAIFGAALGLALRGFQPVVEIYSADFLLAVANEGWGTSPSGANSKRASATCRSSSGDAWVRTGALVLSIRRAWSPTYTTHLD